TVEAAKKTPQGILPSAETAVQNSVIEIQHLLSFDIKDETDLAVFPSGKTELLDNLKDPAISMKRLKPRKTIWTRPHSSTAASP
ncbi:MAG: hypothetical protein LQ347_006806, partial [Umbilicaria vellea]